MRKKSKRLKKEPENFNDGKPLKAFCDKCNWVDGSKQYRDDNQTPWCEACARELRKRGVRVR